MTTTDQQIEVLERLGAAGLEGTTIRFTLTSKDRRTLRDIIPHVVALEAELATLRDERQLEDAVVTAALAYVDSVYGEGESEGVRHFELTSAVAALRAARKDGTG